MTRLLAILTLGVGLVSRAGESQVKQSGIEGSWYGVATAKPDSGFPVSVLLDVSRVRDSLRIALSLPESRLIRLEIPSPYSDSTFATYREGKLHVEFTPDIGLGILSQLGVPREDERIVFDGMLEGDSLAGEIRITRFRSPITLRRGSPTRPYRELAVTFR
ncbi:MAG TPA: hypothetical protein VFK26_07770, partial [Gemmatimonadaceae bacterium]|nr:hypothetical protein [Gemmatimonadaceae bacterium]